MTSLKQLVLIAALAAALTACGKRGPIEQPEGVTTTYPRVYPTR